MAKARRGLAVGIVAALIVAAAAFYVWVFTLCGDCGTPAVLPPG